jgi:hypothetical protein
MAKKQKLPKETKLSENSTQEPSAEFLRFEEGIKKIFSLSTSEASAIRKQDTSKSSKPNEQKTDEE